jgi:hypothetical protein
MMKQLVAAFAILVLLLVGIERARAGFIVWDNSPAATGADVARAGDAQFSYPAAAENLANQQNFAETIKFLTDTVLTGMDIYTVIPQAQVFLGESATIRIWTGSAGRPDTLIDAFTENISAIDSQGTAGITGAMGDLFRVHADFTSPVTLSANTTYWIGMSGTSLDIGQALLVGPNVPPGLLQAFSALTLEGQSATEAMAFRLEGSQVSPVPEPASLMLALIGSFGLLGWHRRCRFARAIRGKLEC